MEIFWSIFWVVFWVMIFIGLAYIFFFTIKILQSIYSIIKTASNVSEQIQSISDLIEDVRTKAEMGLFVDVLELTKRLFLKFKGKKDKSQIVTV